MLFHTKSAAVWVQSMEGPSLQSGTLAGFSGLESRRRGSGGSRGVSAPHKKTSTDRTALRESGLHQRDL